MKKIYTTLSLILFINIAAESATIFQKSYGDTIPDEGKAIVSTSDLGYCIIGRSGSFLPDSADIGLFRLNQAGDLLWSVRIGTPSDDIPSSISKTMDGGFIIAGYTFGSFLDTVNSDSYILRLDSTGFPLWSNFYGGPGEDMAVNAFENADGSYFVFGNVIQSVSGGTDSAYMMLLDVNGIMQWTRVFGVNQKTFLSGADRLSDGSFVVAGSTGDTMQAAGSDHFICRLDTLGNIIWAKKIGTAGEEEAFCVKAVSDGGVLVGGRSDVAGNGNYDANLIRLDDAGNVVWNFNYGTSENDDAAAILENAQGNFIVSGQSNIGTVSNIVFQMLIMEIDSAGNLNWSNTYGDPSGSSGGQSIIPGTDNGYASCGYTVAFSDPNGDAYFVKADSLGNSGCFQLTANITRTPSIFSDSSGAEIHVSTSYESPFILNTANYINQFSQNCFSTGVTALLTSGDIMVYPNPASSFITVDSGNDIHSYILSGSDGRIIANEKLSGNIDVSQLPAGIYSLKLFSTKAVYYKKFVKE